MSNSKPKISIIAAVGKNLELGSNNQLLWKFEADFARLKTLIRGHVLVMGRKTYESIGRELPHSPSVVITSDSGYISPYPNPKHTHYANSLESALDKATTIEKNSSEAVKEIFIFGGARVYEEALPITQTLYLTEIDDSAEEADTFFPTYSEFSNKIEETELEENGIKFRLLTLERG